MKLKVATHAVEKSDESMESGKFGIGDEMVMIDILRNKLYSNKARVIPQEYLSNAWDAHVEAGTTDIPIEVKLPTEFEPTLEIRDFGPGVDPERMSTVFSLYGASTKRSTNKQKGGFGIGAKCAWSYVEQYSVITYVDGVCRHYSMTLDGSKKGEYTLLHQEETDEPNGTKIIIPVAQKDFSGFINSVYRSTEWWSVRPNIIRKNDGHCGTGYHEYDVTFENDNWKILAGSYYNSGGSTAVVDGIPYPINSGSIEGLTRNQETILNNSNVILFFTIAQVDVAASREQLDYTQATQSMIRQTTKKIIDYFDNNVKDVISKEKSYNGALCKWRNDIPHIMKLIISGTTWTTSDGEDLPVNNDVSNNIHTVMNPYYRKMYEKIQEARYCQDDRVSLRLIERLRATEETLVINDDTLRPSTPRLRTLFKEIGHDHVKIISFGENYRDDSGKIIRSKVAEFLENTKICHMDHVFLSDYEKTKTTRKYVSSPKRSGNGYVFGPNHGYSDDNRTQLDFDAVEGYWVPYDLRTIQIAGISCIDAKNSYDVREHIHKALEFIGVDISEKSNIPNVYAIPQRFINKAKNSKLKDLNSLCAEKRNALSAMEIKDILYRYELEKMKSNCVLYVHDDKKRIEQMCEHLDDKAPLKMFIQEELLVPGLTPEEKSLISLYPKYNSYSTILKTINQKVKNLEEHFEEILKNYALIPYDSYSCRSYFRTIMQNERQLQHLCTYINAVDKGK